MAKKVVPKRLVANLAGELKTTLEKWLNCREHGCNDPGYPDGVNMNLLRNHMIYYKREIFKLCNEHQIALPAEYYLPIPPEVDINYFAHPDSPRAKKIVATWGRYKYSDTKETGKSFNPKQLSIF